MPQFDKITFFNQIFWTLILFVFFYLILLKGYLPKIAIILKSRLKKLVKSSLLSENSSLEIIFIVRKSNQQLEKVTNVFRSALIKNIEKSEKTLKKGRNSNLVYKKLFFLYLNFFGQIIIKEIPVTTGQSESGQSLENNFMWITSNLKRVGPRFKIIGNNFLLTWKCSALNIEEFMSHFNNEILGVIGCGEYFLWYDVLINGQLRIYLQLFFNERERVNLRPFLNLVFQNGRVLDKSFYNLKNRWRTTFIKLSQACGEDGYAKNLLITASQRKELRKTAIKMGVRISVRWFTS